MSQPTEKTDLSRRAALGSMATATAGAFGATAGTSRAAEPEPSGPQRATVRDRLWLFTVFAGGDNSSLELGGYRGGSRMTPAEGAFWLNVPNLLLIRSSNLPRLPGNEGWRAKTSYEQYAISFQPLDRVMWSVVGSGGRMHGDEVSPVLKLAKEFPNITGVILDDFFVRKEGDPKKRTGAYSPDDLGRLRDRLVVSGRRLEMWATFYSRALDPSAPGHFEIDRPLAEYLDQFDVVTLWTRGDDRLENLEEYFEKLEEACPGPAKAIGCDFWDFRNKAPVPVRLMEHQCKLGLKWLREKRMREMVFLGNTSLDVGLPSAEFARQWIDKVGNEPL